MNRSIFLQNNLKLLCYGDSNTYGYDPREPFGGRYDAENRWCDLLMKQSGWTVVNCGQNGRTLLKNETGFAVLEQYISAHEPDAILIMLGSNDILMSSFPDIPKIAECMDALLHHLQSRYPNLTLILLSPPPITLSEPVLANALSALIAEYRALSAEYCIRFIDTHAWQLPISFDGVHLSAAAHHIFAEQLYHALISI